MCNKTIQESPWSLLDVPDQLEILEMCKRAIEEGPCTLKFGPDEYKAPDMCERAVEEELYSLSIHQIVKNSYLMCLPKIS